MKEENKRSNRRIRHSSSTSSSSSSSQSSSSYSSSSSSSESDSDSTESDDDQFKQPNRRKKIKLRDLQSKRDHLLSQRFGYTNENNPFADSNLSKPFVWKKKLAILQAAAADASGASKYDKKSKRVKSRRKQHRRKDEGILSQTMRKLDEIDRVRHRRQTREEEERLLEEAQVRLAREREQESFGEWKVREEAFFRDSVKQRTDIRLQQGRECMIDLLVKSMRMSEGERFKNACLLHSSADVFMETLSADRLKALLTEAEEQHQIYRSAVEMTDMEYETERQLISYARRLERLRSVGGKSDAGNNRSDDKSDDRSDDDEDEESRNVIPTRNMNIRYLKFWSSLLLVGTEILERKLNKSREQECGVRDSLSGVAMPIVREIEKRLEGKSEEELNRIEAQIQGKLKLIKSDSSSSEDASYWESIIERIPFHKSVAELRRIHRLAAAAAAALKRNAPQVTQQLLQPPQSDTDETKTRNRRRRREARRSAAERESDGESEGESESDSDSTLHEEEEEDPTAVSAGPSHVWPPLKSTKNLDVNDLMSLEEFNRSRVELRKVIVNWRRMEFARRKAEAWKLREKTKSSTAVYSDFGSEIFEKFIREESLAMPPDECVLNSTCEMMVTKQQLLLPVGSDSSVVDRFKLRRPRFFNRVKTGFEWSRYNQSHFDRDNPPPKAVQGYKFSIFYSELIDATKTPKWRLLQSDTPETVHIRFSAGAPYEDLMFKIVNREWDMNPKKGFRNTFDRGILQLHFNFKRFRYRK